MYKFTGRELIPLILFFITFTMGHAADMAPGSEKLDPDDALLRHLCTRPGMSAEKAFDCRGEFESLSDKVQHSLPAMTLHICAPKGVPDKECFQHAYKFFQSQGKSGFLTWLERGMKYC